MIGIDIDVRSDSAEGSEAEVFVRTTKGPILMTENPALAVGLKIEAVISLLRDIESDFAMLSIDLQQDNNRVICSALAKRVESLTNELENELTQHNLSEWTVSETFGYMWSNDYQETLFIPAVRADLMQASDGKMTEADLLKELATMKQINKIYDQLDGHEED